MTEVDMVKNELEPWDVGRHWYKTRRVNHRLFWQWFAKFVSNKNIRSMLEIGGGLGTNSQLVERYTGVERNERAIRDGQIAFPSIELIYGDWLKIDTEQFRNRYDLVLAAAVVEHCPHYQEFIRKMLAIEARWTIVTFFLGLNRDEDVMATRNWRYPPRLVHFNKYSGRLLRNWLAEQGLDGRYEILNFPRRDPNNAVLLIRGEHQSAKTGKAEMVGVL